MRKRRLCVKMSPRAAAKTALHDVQLIAKSKYHLVNYTTIGWAMRERRHSWHFCQLTPTESFLGAAVWLLPFVCAARSTVWGCGIEWETLHRLSLQPCPLKPMCQPPPSGKVVRVGRRIVGSNPRLRLWAMLASNRPGMATVTDRPAYEWLSVRRLWSIMDALFTRPLL